ncbi:MAG: hypothetical protein PSY12_08785 [bacterium]|nr:hypothetical protein [bacterium]
MASARVHLLTMLERVADGGDLTAQELNAAIPDPLLLDQREKAAWEELSHWADDEDIRAKDAHYTGLKRQWMRDHMSALQQAEWYPHPPTSRQRIVAGIWLAAFLPSVTSYSLGWRMFGQYDKPVFIALLFIGIWMMLPVFALIRRH